MMGSQEANSMDGGGHGGQTLVGAALVCQLGL